MIGKAVVKRPFSWKLFPAHPLVLMTFSTLARLPIAALAAICCSTAADAALTLTIDTNARTFSWSGSVTSEAYELNQYSRWLQIGDDGFNGGQSFGFAPLLTLSSAGNGIDTYSDDPGQLILVTSGPSIHTDIATLGYNSASPMLSPVTVTGNNQTQGFVDQAIPFFESLNGRTLYFYDVQLPTGGDPIRIGAPVGTIVVIPEPAVGLLSLGGLLMTFRRKRN
jgi:hypothetical protein